MWVNLQSCLPQTEREIRAANPNTSYPIPMPDNIPGYTKPQATEAPAAMPGHRVIAGPPEQVGDEWRTTWVQQAMSEAEIATALADACASKLTEINCACDSDLDALKAGYPSGEVQSWERQLAEALALQADLNAATPTLTGIAVARGIDRIILAARIIDKAGAYATLCGAIIGRRQALEDAIEEASSIADLAGINWAS